MANETKKEITTMEQLKTRVSASYGAVVKYNDKVFVTDCNWKGGFTASIYEFENTAEATGLAYIESNLTLITEAEERFEDNGHAIAWCIAQTK